MNRSVLVSISLPIAVLVASTLAVGASRPVPAAVDCQQSVPAISHQAPEPVPPHSKPE